MPRGPKKHLKRLNAPHHWMLGKMEGVWAPKPSPGPHKMRECLPLCLILRNRLKYALTNKEAMQICMERHVKVDGKVRSDHNYPAGFMDVVEMPKSNDTFRLMYDSKGRFILHRIKAACACSPVVRSRRPRSWGEAWRGWPTRRPRIWRRISSSSAAHRLVATRPP